MSAHPETTRPAQAVESGIDARRSKLHYALWRSAGQPGQLIPLLQIAQDKDSYVSETAIRTISGITGIPEAEIYGVVTFYKQFRLKPRGRNVIKLCDGTACHVNNAKGLHSVIADQLGLEAGDTTDDGLFTLELVACLGCCSLAPAMMVNEQTFGRLTPQSVRRILKRYRREAESTAGR